MKIFSLSIILSACCAPAWSFINFNPALRFAFRQATKESGWPTVASPLVDINDCSHYNATVRFPPYYLRNFHAYTGGNLNPVAAKEAKSAESAVFKHHYKHLSGSESCHFIRSGFSITARSKNVYAGGEGGTQRVVDLGCGTGTSTRYLKDHFRDADVTGIDLSPFYLQETGEINARFVHGDITATGIASGTVDVVCLSYVLHELPCDVSFQVLREATRILKPHTGVLAVLDMYNPTPSSATMKYIFGATEPYLDQYKNLMRVFEDFLRGEGFEDVDVYRQIPKTIMCVARRK